MRLQFQGGPWADRMVDSAVATPPAVVSPVDEQLGEYRRTEQQPDSSAVVYEWSSPGSDAASEPDSSTHVARREAVTESRATMRRLGELVRLRAALRIRFALDVTGAVSALALAILTVLSPAWIEFVIRVDPDHGSGALEWAVVFALAALSLMLAFAARRQWRKLTAAA